MAAKEEEEKEAEAEEEEEEEEEDGRDRRPRIITCMMRSKTVSGNTRLRVHRLTTFRTLSNPSGEHRMMLSNVLSIWVANKLV